MQTASLRLLQPNLPAGHTKQHCRRRLLDNPVWVCVSPLMWINALVETSSLQKVKFETFKIPLGTRHRLCTHGPCYAKQQNTNGSDLIDVQWSSWASSAEGSKTAISPLEIRITNF